MDLLRKIESHDAVISVIGLGYVGLPLAVAFAEAGFRVIGIDVDEARVESVNAGVSYLKDLPSERLVALRPERAQGRGELTAVAGYDTLDEVDAVLVCVPTPLSKTREPDLSHVIAACDGIARRLHPGMLVVLESTTYPGTTEELFLPRLQDAKGQELGAGTDFFLAFSPERIDPGRTDWTVQNTPKVIGGMTQRCLEAAVKLYESAIETVVPVSSTMVAEMVKLLENTFRATNVALVNEIAIMCGRLGVDVWEVIDAAGTKPYGFMPFYPGPGLGGHCIPVDPRYLAWKLRTLNYNPRFIQLAEEINLAMPEYVLGKIADALNQSSKPLRGSKVVVLGVGYKADVDDTRDSPALDVIDLLLGKGAVVSYHDPYVPELRLDKISMTSVPLDEATLRESDCVVITTAHTSYDWQWIVDNSKLVVDTRNATKGVLTESGRVVRL